MVTLARLSQRQVGRKRTPARTPGQLRVAIYARVSTEEQAKRETVEPQLKALRAWADREDWDIEDEYVDNGISGTVDLDCRPAGARLVSQGKAGAFDAVLVYHTSRLGRDLFVIMAAAKGLLTGQIRLRCHQEGYDLDEPYGILQFAVSAGVAHVDRAGIVRRTTDGRNAWLAKQQWMGVIPFGYDVRQEDTHHYLVPSERVMVGLGQTESAYMAWLFGYIAAGHSLYSEVRRLNGLGVPSPGCRYTRGKHREGGQWNAATLSKMLRATTYIGRHVYEAAAGPIEREVPPLTTPEVFEAVARQLQANRRLSRKNARHEYLLRGMIWCSCRPERPYSYVGTTRVRKNGVERTYYRCGSVVSTYGRPEGHHCPEPAVRGDVLEKEVLAGMERIFADPEAALAVAQAQHRDRQADLSGQAEEEEQARAVVRRLQKARDQIQRRDQQGFYTDEEYATYLQENTRDLGAAELRVRELENERAVAEATEAQLKSAAHLLREMRAKYQRLAAASPQELRAVLEKLVARIEVRDGVANIRWHLRLPASAVELLKGSAELHYCTIPLPPTTCHVRSCQAA